MFLLVIALPKTAKASAAVAILGSFAMTFCQWKCCFTVYRAKILPAMCVLAYINSFGDLLSFSKKKIFVIVVVST
jgi:hypothetical protein